MEKRIRQIALISLPFLILTLIIILIIPDNSHPKNIIDFRKENKEHYENGLLIHTEDALGRYYDFVIKNNETHVIAVRIENRRGYEIYKYGSSTVNIFSAVVENNVSYYNEHGTLRFDTSWELELKAHKSEKKVSWCFMDDSYVDNKVGIDIYPFQYEGKNYILYIKAEENK